MLNFSNYKLQITTKWHTRHPLHPHTKFNRSLGPLCRCSKWKRPMPCDTVLWHWLDLHPPSESLPRAELSVYVHSSSTLALCTLHEHAKYKKYAKIIIYFFYIISEWISLDCCSDNIFEYIIILGLWWIQTPRKKYHTFVTFCSLIDCVKHCFSCHVQTPQNTMGLLPQIYSKYTTKDFYLSIYPTILGKLTKFFLVDF